MNLILHNIRSVHNVGSIFRTAEAAGVEKICLTGITAAPVDRFGRPSKALAKVALGAEKMVAWEQCVNLSKLIQNLKKEGNEIVALEQASTSVDYRKFEQKRQTAIILGNEVKGLPNTILNKCDAILEIPMRGKKESLNVAVAAGILLFSPLES